jgi:hypothetical protein
MKFSENMSFIARISGVKIRHISNLWCQNTSLGSMILGKKLFQVRVFLFCCGSYGNFPALLGVILQKPFNTLFRARTGTRVEPPTFHKSAR